MKDAYLVSITLIRIKEANKMISKEECDMCGKFYGDYNFAKDDKNINGIMIFNLDTQDYYYTNRPLDIFPNCKYSFEKYLKFLNKKGKMRL